MAKFGEFVAAVEDEKPACFMISETWLNSQIPDSLIAVPGYSVFRGDRGDRRGGGVCIYVKDSLFKNCVVAESKLDVPQVESVCLLLKHRCFDLALCCIYRPPDSSLTSDTMLFDALSGLAAAHRTLLICGDFNLPGMSWPSPTANSNASRLLLDMLDNTHLLQIVSEPTRFRHGQRPSLLDLVITSEEDLVSNLRCMPPLGKSDHSVLGFHIQLSLKSQPRRTSIDKTFINFETINCDLSRTDWASVLSMTTVEECWSSFCDTLLSVKSHHTVTRKYSLCPSKPWINGPIIKMIRVKKSMWQRYRRSGLDSDYAGHRRLSNELSALISFSRREYELGIVNSSNPKRLYKYVRSSLSSKVATPQLRNEQGEVTGVDEEVASIFAESFAASFTIEPDGVLPTTHQASRMQESLTEVVFTEELVLEKLTCLDVTKSQGPDGISAAYLKSCAASLCFPICLLLQKSFECSSLPTIWRTATIKPIFKRGDKFEAKNYRPISLIPIVAKVMESIIVDVMKEFLLLHNIIPSQQHGFTRGRSVVTNLLTCLNDWTNSVDSGSSVDVVYLDFSSAFDRVPKQRLLSKLEHVGIRGRLLLWVSAFLSSRQFSVRVGSAISNRRPVLSGVPQGSVLGPLLFNIYTSDLQYILQTRFSMYADDVKLYDDSSNPSILQKDLDAIFLWSQLWLLPLNVGKCVVLYIGKDNPKQSYFIEGTSLKHVSSHSDLGVVISSDLSWSEQVIRQVKKANSIGYLISKVFSSFSVSMTSKLFKTYVRPILEYSNPVWCPLLVRDINMLESVQRRFTRLPYGVQRPSYEARLEAMSLCPLESRRRRGDLIFTYKALHNGTSPVHQLFVLNTDERLRGHSLKLSRSTFRTSCRQNFLPNRVFHAWNALPNEAVTAPSTNSFKNYIDSVGVVQ